MLCRCLRCNHRWKSRDEEGSKRCPACRAVRWRVPGKPGFKSPAGNHGDSEIHRASRMKLSPERRSEIAAMGGAAYKGGNERAATAARSANAARKRAAMTPKIIDLRAQGLSWLKIARQLGIAEPTAMKWGKSC